MGRRPAHTSLLTVTREIFDYCARSSFQRRGMKTMAALEKLLVKPDFHIARLSKPVAKFDNHEFERVLCLVQKVAVNHSGLSVKLQANRLSCHRQSESSKRRINL
jgi:hypothetical protein